MRRRGGREPAASHRADESARQRTYGTCQFRHGQMNMKRSGFSRKESYGHSEHPQAKEGSCAHCGNPFLKLRPLQSVCSPICASRKVKADRKAERETDRKRKEDGKTLPTLHKEARYWFNRWVLLRDAAEPCISCGKPPPDLSGLHAGRDCGHYRSVGSAGHLRYTETNAAAQCVHCNQYLAGNPVGYRKGLIERRGLEVVEAMENNNQPEKWQRDQVRGIRDDFKARCKELESNK